MLDASHQISVWALGSGWTRRVAFAIASFVAQNARSWTAFQASSKSFWRDMFLSWLSGATFPDACLTKRWKNAQIPKNRSSSLGVVGTGNRLIASTLSGGIEIPRESTTCPRNVSDGSPSWHLFLLRRRPLSLSLWKRHCKSLTWSSLHLLPTIKSSM